MARYIEDQRETELFVAGSLESLVPETSTVRLVWSALGSLDFDGFDALYKNAQMGRPALDPRRLVGVWILALLRGVSSSVGLAEMCGRDVEFRWMLGDAPVEKSTLCEFRTAHKQRLVELGVQVLAALSRGGLLPGESVAVDGTIIRAAASCRSVQTRKRLVKRIERLKQVITEKLNEPETAAMDAYKDRHARLERALAQMNALGLKDDKARLTMTEPEATTKLLKKPGGFAPGYNVQVTTDTQTGVIIHSEVIEGSNDLRQLKPQLEQTEAVLDDVKGADHNVSVVAADSGYHDTLQLVELEGRGVQCFVPEDRVKNWKPRDVSDAHRANAFVYDPETDTMRCPQGRTLRRRKMNPEKTSVVYQAQKKECDACPAKAHCCPKSREGRYVNYTAYPDVLHKVSEQTASDEGRKYKRARWVSAEGAFARIKGLLHWTRCRCWGRKGVEAELAWYHLAHNLMLLAGAWKPITLERANAG